MNGMSMVNVVNWDEVPEASLLRAAADGELPAEAEAALRASAGDGRVDRVASFERALRGRVGAAMSESSAPVGLRDRLRAAMEPERVITGEEPEGVIARRERSFWSGGGPLIGLAAAVALAAVVWVLAPGGRTAGSPIDGMLAQAAVGLAAEHSECLTDPSHFAIRGEQAGADPGAYITERIGDLPVNLRLGDEGFRLSGLGACPLPTGGRSVHLLYEPEDSGLEPVSLFVQNAATAETTLREDAVYTSGQGGPPYVRVWRRGGVVYYLVTECPVTCSTAEQVYALGGDAERL